MALISICIPVYNAEKYLNDCLKPLIKMGDDVQIILSDDGSTDTSLSICREYEKQNANIVVVTGENGGPSAARNRGMEKITGDYIIFCDADDWLETETYEYVRTVVNEYQPDFIQFGLFNVRDNNREALPLYCSETKLISPEDYDDLFALTCGYHDNRDLPFASYGLVTCKVFKSSLIRGIQFNPDVVGEDTLFALQVMNRAQKPFFLAKHLYNYRIVANSYSRKVYPGITKKAVKMLCETRNILGIETTEKEKLKDAYYLRCYDFMQWCVRSSIPYNQATFSQRKRELREICSEPIYKNALKNISGKLVNTKNRIFIKILRHKLWSIATLILSIKNEKRKKDY